MKKFTLYLKEISVKMTEQKIEELKPGTVDWFDEENESEKLAEFTDESQALTELKKHSSSREYTGGIKPYRIKDYFIEIEDEDLISREYAPYYDKFIEDKH